MVQASRPNTMAKRLTPRTAEQRAQDEQECKLPVVSEDESLDGDDDDEDDDEEKVYLASGQTHLGSLDNTNQSPSYEDTEYLSAEDARERMLLENHKQRMSFMQHLVIQAPDNVNKVLATMMPETNERMALLENVSAQKVRDADSRRKGNETNKRLAEERRSNESAK